MNNIWFYIIFVVVLFVILEIGVKFFKKDALFTIAIGTLIGANIYSSNAYPVQAGSLIFGIDSVVYTVFTFCLLVYLIDYGKKDMLVVLYTSMFSLFFTGFLAFVGGWISGGGYSPELLANAMTYIASIIATYCAIWVMTWVFKWCKKRGLNLYFAVIFALFGAEIINSLLYYGIYYLYAKSLGAEFLGILLGSYIIKGITALLCLCIVAYHRWIAKLSGKPNRKYQILGFSKPLAEIFEEAKAEKVEKVEIDNTKQITKKTATTGSKTLKKTKQTKNKKQN